MKEKEKGAASEDCAVFKSPKPQPRVNVEERGSCKKRRSPPREELRPPLFSGLSWRFSYPPQSSVSGRKPDREKEKSAVRPP